MSDTVCAAPDGCEPQMDCTVPLQEGKKNPQQKNGQKTPTNKTKQKTPQSLPQKNNHHHPNPPEV